MGHDKLSTSHLTLIINGLLKPHTVLANRMLKEGVFPASLIIAKIFLLLKGNEKFILNNYWPIALLPAVSKVFEQLSINV